VSRVVFHVCKNTPLFGVQSADNACRVILNKRDGLKDTVWMVRVRIPSATSYQRIAPLKFASASAEYNDGSTSLFSQALIYFHVDWPERDAYLTVPAMAASSTADVRSVAKVREAMH
jgi:hypothetical protein